VTDGANFTYGPVGREKQLDLIAETIRGENKVGLVLLGEAGIGKTTLARVARTLARTNGLCSAFVQVAETKGFPSRHALVHLVSELEECRDQHQKLDKQTDQTELGRPSSYVPSLIEIVQTLDDAGSSSPLVLIVDDLHLMPRRSAQELWAIVRASRSDIRFIGTARATHSGDLSHLGSSGDFPLLWHLLEPLTREGIIELSRRLLGGDLLPSAGALLSKRSQGNPLLARITLEEWRRHGSLIEVADYWDVSSDAYDEEPLSLTQAMQGRLVGLSRHELEMLQTIAILDRSLTLEECERYASLGVNVALDSVTTLIEAGFVVAERGSQTVVSISHPTIQSAAVASLDPVRRARLHEHIFERMLDRRMGLNDLPVTEVAHHGVLGLRKRPELVGCLEEAARYALEGEDHAAAASWFRALLDIQGASSDWRTWFRYATATSNLSPEDAIQHFSEALARSSDDDARAQILFGRAVAHRRVGGFEEAKADLERASTLESALRDFDIPDRKSTRLNSSHQI